MRSASALRRSVLLALPVALVAGALAGISAASGVHSGRVPVSISTVSTRADLVSGGDALVRIATIGDFRPSLRVSLNGHDVTSEFRKNSDGRGLGLLTGLRVGRNVVTATIGTGDGARLVITNHPLGGPVFAGPQIKPWTCGNGSKSPKCYQKPTFSYSYVDQMGNTQ